MSEGLDLIKRQQPEIIDGFPTGNIYIGVTEEELAELEKALKVLQIIKEKRVWVDALTVMSLKEYNDYCKYVWITPELTKEEYDLLKEVLS